MTVPATRSLQVVLRDALAVSPALRIVAGVFASTANSDRRYANVVVGGQTVTIPNLNGAPPGAPGGICYILADDSRMYLLGAVTQQPVFQGVAPLPGTTLEQYIVAMAQITIPSLAAGIGSALLPAGGLDTGLGATTSPNGRPFNYARITGSFTTTPGSQLGWSSQTLTMPNGNLGIQIVANNTSATTMAGTGFAPLVMIGYR